MGTDGAGVTLIDGPGVGAVAPSLGSRLDLPLRVLLVSPAQYSGFATDPNFRSFQASAMARAGQAGNHPLFLGEAGLWNGILIVKMHKPIRFYAGDEIK